ncbi:GNAT family N-acyltransferase [Shewanella sp.]|uniref:GNAT family N-acyltransferase n=1 Tax=Shewanella sp. TaxID=50422 RepID=UPI00356A218F
MNRKSCSPPRPLAGSPDTGTVMIFTVDNLIDNHLPKLSGKSWLKRPVSAALKYLLHEEECNRIATEFGFLRGVDFAGAVLETLNFSFSVPDADIDNIPRKGRVVIFANHPIGSLDALAMIKLIGELRPDIKVVANEILMAIEPLHPILLPVRNMGGGTPKQHLEAIHRHLQNEGALLIFPAGEVSRLRPNGVRDTRWQSGFLKIAQACDAPLLPMYADARNSATFYGTSMIYKPLSTLLLVKEMFRQKQRTMPMRIGELIALDTLRANDFDRTTMVSLLKNHLYRIGKNRPPLFRTQSPIARPECRAELKAALDECERLGETADGKGIYLYRHKGASPIMREIGRLREVAFRAVGEGTGKRRDIDAFDSHYFHLVLWDGGALEIVGAYRFACAASLHQTQGSQSLYSQSLFDYTDAFAPCFAQGLELGRSFVQPKYWGKRSLDYLWFGIGAFIARHPQYRYLFGPVSISGQMPLAAREMLVHFYQHFYGTAEPMARAKQPFRISLERRETLDSLYQGLSEDEAFKRLKHTLSGMGVAVPTLYKQYSDLCSEGGVSFADFGVDPDFNHCIDGLVRVDLTRLKPKKHERYIGAHQQCAQNPCGSKTTQA